MCDCKLTRLSFDEIISLCKRVDDIPKSDSKETQDLRIKWFAHELRFILGGRIHWKVYKHCKFTMSDAIKIVLSDLVCEQTGPASKSCERKWTLQFPQKMPNLTTDGITRTWQMHKPLGTDFRPQIIRQIRVDAVCDKLRYDGKLLPLPSLHECIRMFSGTNLHHFGLFLCNMTGVSTESIQKLNIHPMAKKYFVDELQALQAQFRATYTTAFSNEEQWNIDDLRLYYHQRIDVWKQSDNDFVRSKFKRWLTWDECTLVNQREYLFLVDFHRLSTKEKSMFASNMREYMESLHETSRALVRNELLKSANEQEFHDRLWIELILTTTKEYNLVESIAGDLRKTYATVSWSTLTTYEPSLSWIQTAVLFCLVDDLDKIARNIVHAFLAKGNTDFRTFAKPYYKRILSKQPVKRMTEDELWMRIRDTNLTCANKHITKSQFQYAQWDDLPDQAEIVHGQTFVNFVRAQKFQNTGVLPDDALLPDLWNMICSFLFGYAEYVVLSIPRQRLTDQDDGPFAFRELCERGVHHFLGPESGAEYFIERNGTLRRVQGGCPFNCSEMTGTCLSVYQNDDREKFDASDRFLVGMLPQLPVVWPKPSNRKEWRTWRTHFAKNQCFSSLADVKRAFMNDSESRLNECVYYVNNFVLHFEDGV